ncbi:hypothetical protein GCM10027422_08400 [Hymenobacter arcticus]
MPFLRTLLTYGLLLGLLLGLYTTLMWLTRLDTTYLATGQYLDMAVGLLPVGFIAAAIHRQRRQSHLSGLRRVALGIGVMALAELLYRPYLYLYHTVINPSWFAAVLALKQTELLAAGRSAASIATELAHLQISHSQQTGMFHGFWLSAMGLPVLVTLLTWPLLRNRIAGSERLLPGGPPDGGTMYPCRMGDSGGGKVGP